MSDEQREAAINTLLSEGIYKGDREELEYKTNDELGAYIYGAGWAWDGSAWVNVAELRIIIAAYREGIHDAKGALNAETHRADVAEQERDQLRAKVQSVPLYAQYTHKAWKKGSPVMTFEDWYRLVNLPSLEDVQEVES